VDSDGDIVRSSAFTDGQEVPMVWSHDWTMPIGKGKVVVEPERAVFNGRLWLDTDDGVQAYRKIKNAGTLQEFSWGFRILDAEPGEQDGMPVRYITKAEVFEVSPVLVGANRETYTLAIKGRRRISRGQIEGAIAVLTALLGDDEAEEIDATAGETPADDGKAVKTTETTFVDVPVDDLAVLLLAQVESFTDRLKAAPDADLAGIERHLEDLKAALGRARGAAEDGLARAASAKSVDVPTLYREFRRLEGLYGPVHGQRAG
jgi:HK97 family phage prohead protease